MQIKKGTNNFYIGNDKTNADAQITYQIEGNTLIVDHTYVSPKLRGQGVANKLLDTLLDYARQNNFKIKPVCPYVFSMFEKKPEWHYLLD